MRVAQEREDNKDNMKNDKNIYIYIYIYANDSPTIMLYHDSPTIMLYQDGTPLGWKSLSKFPVCA